ncbi:restriction endonuclease [Streptomyces sp. NPDC058464]|uniref:restriction endonuclease n=1 Tax=Streptomyces sp. NPDC058464 TaxID=3346511 RepID=UPI0036675BCE
MSHWRAGCCESDPSRSGRGRRKRTRATGTSPAAYSTQYSNPVGSGHVQQFNGTARPHHGADLPIMIALNGFTEPAIKFAQHHQLILMGRAELKKWAHGRHLYDVLGIHSATP